MERFAQLKSATIRRALPLAAITVLAGAMANRPDTATRAAEAAPDDRALVIGEAPLEFVRLLPGIPRPSSVAVALDGRIVVTDATTPVAKAFLPDGGEVTLSPAPREPEEPAGAPFGVTVDEAGNVFVSDAARREMRVYRPSDPNPKPFAGPEWGERVPGALFARDGRLYAADIENHQVVVIDIASERLVSVVGSGHGSGPTQLRYPNGIWVAADGVIYVSDTNNDRILRFRPDGSALPLWAGPFKNPRGLAGDGNGRFFVANTLAHEVLVLDGAGEVTGRVTRAGSAEIGFPTGLAVAGDRLFVTDRDAHGVFEWRLTEGRRAP